VKIARTVEKSVLNQSFKNQYRAVDTNLSMVGTKPARSIQMGNLNILTTQYEEIPARGRRASLCLPSRRQVLNDGETFS